MLTTALVTAAMAVSEPPKTPVRTAHSTSYCLLGTMADGTYTRKRSVAMNRHPLGTKIRVKAVYLNGKKVSTRVRGLKRFVVRDRIGYGSELDFWSPSCGWSNWFGRRTVKYQIVR